MTSHSTMAMERPKKLVRYGKASSTSTWSTKHVDTWLEDNSDSEVSPPSAKRLQTIKATYQVQKPVAKVVSQVEIEEPVKELARSAAKQVKKPVKPQDLFDVPSSEDEPEVEFVPKRAVPPKPKQSRMLFDDTQEAGGSAPWDRRKKRVADAERRGNGERAGAQLKGDLAKESESMVHTLPTTSCSSCGSKLETPTEQKLLTAAARLAARKQQTHATAEDSTITSTATQPASKASKRGATTASSLLEQASKRARKVTSLSSHNKDTNMMNNSPTLVCQSPVKSVAVSPDVFDVPVDDLDFSPKQPGSSGKRRIPAPSTRTTPHKGVSAPARLAEMLPIDTDTTEVLSRSPSLPHSHQSTPKRDASSTPGRAGTAAGALTPKQTELWSQLLPSDHPAPSPSRLAIKELTLSGRRRRGGAVSSISSTLAKSRSDVPELHTRRVRLVDRLKASAPSSDLDDSDEESDDEDLDAPIELAETGVEFVLAANADEQQIKALQPQANSQSAIEGGPKITYARTRSYLPEENLEDGLLFDLPAFTPVKPAGVARQASRTNTASQKSAFDLDDSDDEANSGRMRTIHELRAAGRNNRFMQETETLLEDATHSSAAAKTRRRNALVELALKLMDKAYAERFYGQGMERVLADSIATCGRDVVADLPLSAAFALLMLADPPEHTVKALGDSGVLTAFTYMLEDRSDSGTLVKDRQSNMAKTAQGTFVNLVSTLLSHEALWGESGSASVSPRVMALKMLDLLVGRLRRSGDRTELLTHRQLQLVLPEGQDEHPNSVMDTGLAISVLESLSSSALNLEWPEALLQRLAITLPELHAHPETRRHIIFLALRLILNLTNDNPRNCAIFAQNQATIQYLFTAVGRGFTHLEALPPPTTTSQSDQEDTLTYDLLVLSTGCTINLSEHSPLARHQILSDPATNITLLSLLRILTHAQNSISSATSLTESARNVAFGYLSILLANLCLDPDVRTFVAGHLPGRNLGLVVDCVEEFLRHHERVDGLVAGGAGAFEGEEGQEVWGGFTEKLRGVLGRIRGVAAEGEAG
ncbi:hypothetical protein LTR62_008597 [Meristemomyces frigidus]|uniref:Wings apart-like protein C-terminal domain-containing protein n=1 Tax=Meristemomyces frigidus TaxID=1508187 RepID=A0AAN7TAV1_9PEZI|nr:hypothetical protein LTR62_008597 [Meristemomyces frigidus]